MSVATARTENARCVSTPSPWAGGREEAHLVARVRAGDDRAFEELYRRYAPQILGFLRRLTGDEARAEDLLQETFISALRRIRASDQQLALKSWLFEIARNAAIDAWRRANRAGEVPLERLSESEREPAGEPEAAVVARQRLELLRGAFDELPDQQARALVLRELEGCSYEEIAERLALSRSAVESTIFRARRRLEREYERLADGTRCRTTREAVLRVAAGRPRRSDEQLLARHCRRCATCRRYARAQGVEPLRTLRDRIAAALSPIPLAIERLLGRLAGGGVPALPDFPALGAKSVAAAAAALAALGSAVSFDGDRAPIASGPAVVAPAASGGAERSAESGGRGAVSGAARRSRDDATRMERDRGDERRAGQGDDRAARSERPRQSGAASGAADRPAPWPGATQRRSGGPVSVELPATRGVTETTRGTVGGTLGGVVGGAGGTLGGTVSHTGETLGGVTGSVGGVLGGTVRGVGGVLGDATGNERLGEGVGRLGDVVEGVVQGVGGAVGSVTGGLGGAVEGASGAVGGLLGGSR